MTSKWLAFIHSLDVKQNKPILKPVSQHHTLSASRETLGIIQSNSSNFLVRKQRSRKGSKLGSGSQEEDLSPPHFHNSALSFYQMLGIHTQRQPVQERVVDWNYYKKRAGRVCGIEGRSRKKFPHQTMPWEGSWKQMEEA